MNKKPSIYERAKKNGSSFEATCVSITKYKWDELMKGARPANQRKVVKAALAAGVIDEWQAKEELKKPFFNPYGHFVTKTHIVYVNSAIEHFIRVH